MTPHIVRPIEGANNQVEKHTVDCDRKYFDIVVEGMAMAASSGTARGASIDSVVICGKNRDSSESAWRGSLHFHGLRS